LILYRFGQKREKINNPKAAERLLFHLKQIKEEGKDLALELSSRQDTLAPFLLAFESKHMKLVSIAGSCRLASLFFNNLYLLLSLSSRLHSKDGLAQRNSFFFSKSSSFLFIFFGCFHVGT
jgi:hypothetical protein